MRACLAKGGEIFSICIACLAARKEAVCRLGEGFPVFKRLLASLPHSLPKAKAFCGVSPSALPVDHKIKEKPFCGCPQKG
jgi:hypothetical protein